MGNNEDNNRPVDVSLDDTTSEARHAFMKSHEGDDGGKVFDRWLGEMQVQAKLEALNHARKVISPYVSTAEKWRYDKVMRAFGIMLNELPEDAPEPEAPRPRFKFREEKYPFT